MAELLSLNQANASVNDTYQGLKIVQLLDAPNGRYRWQLNASSGASAATNLSYTASPTGGTVASDTGTDATLPLADATNAGLSRPIISQTLTDAATIAFDLANGRVAVVTLGANRTIAAPTNFIAGETGIINVIQDGTGSRTLTWNAAYKFSGGVAPNLTTTANARDVFYIFSHDGSTFTVSYSLDVK